jgi:hypothetical protein
MKWLRLWTEWGHDPKIIAMPEHMQARHIKLLCLRRQCETCTLSDEEIAAYMRISLDDLQETKELFQRKKFIDNGWNVLAWDDRQLVSDSGAERQRRYRERLKKKSSDVTVTSPLRHSNGLDTDTDTDTDKDKEKKTYKEKKERVKKKIAYSDEFESFWYAYPRKEGKGYAFKQWKKIASPKPTLEQLRKSIENYNKTEQWGEHRYIPQPSKFIYQRMWEDEPKGGRKYL